VQHAESLGWRVFLGGSHSWGSLYCPHQQRDGCKIHVDSTPRNPEGHARKLMALIGRCQHAQENP
jgi:hypothetical protein